MKHLLVIFLLVISFNSFGQTSADPATSQSNVENPENNKSVPATNLFNKPVINYILPVTITREGSKLATETRKHGNTE